MLGLQTESMGVRIGCVGGGRSADWLCPHEPSRSRMGSLDKLSDVLPGILVPAGPRRNAPVVLQLVYSKFRLGQFEGAAAVTPRFFNALKPPFKGATHGWHSYLESSST